MKNRSGWIPSIEHFKLSERLVSLKDAHGGIFNEMEQESLRKYKEMYTRIEKHELLGDITGSVAYWMKHKEEYWGDELMMLEFLSMCLLCDATLPIQPIIDNKDTPLKHLQNYIIIQKKECSIQEIQNWMADIEQEFDNRLSLLIVKGMASNFFEMSKWVLMFIGKTEKIDSKVVSEKVPISAVSKTLNYVYSECLELHHIISCSNLNINNINRLFVCTNRVLASIPYCIITMKMADNAESKMAYFYDFLLKLRHSYDECFDILCDGKPSFDYTSKTYPACLKTTNRTLLSIEHIMINKTYRECPFPCDTSTDTIDSYAHRIKARKILGITTKTLDGCY